MQVSPFRGVMGVKLLIFHLHWKYAYHNFPDRERCCNGDSTLGNFSGHPVSQTTEAILIQLGIIDYVGWNYHHAKLGYNRFSGDFTVKP